MNFKNRPAVSSLASLNNFFKTINAGLPNSEASSHIHVLVGELVEVTSPLVLVQTFFHCDPKDSLPVRAWLQVSCRASRAQESCFNLERLWLPGLLTAKPVTGMECLQILLTFTEVHKVMGSFKSIYKLALKLVQKFKKLKYLYAL